MKDALGHGSNPHGTHSDGITALPTAYDMAKAHGEKLNAEYKRTAGIMNAYPKGPMGLTPDHIKATPEWQANRQAAKAAFQALRNHNAQMSKYFKKEMKADRDARRASRIK